MAAGEQSTGQSGEDGTNTALAIRSSRPGTTDVATSPGVMGTYLCGSSLFPATSAPQLSGADLDLFGHYLEHTSRTMQIDPQNQYAWRVGIPNLAIRSSLLMHSVLAVAAVCKCTDLVSGLSASSVAPYGSPAPPSYADIEAVWEMLHVAMAHHEQSIRFTTQAISGSAADMDPQIVVLNAYLMVPYAMVSHRVQRWLSCRSSRAASPACNLEPKAERESQPGWISAIRATHYGILSMRKLAKDTAAENESSSSSRIEWSASEMLQEGVYLISQLRRCIFNRSLQTGPLLSSPTQHVLFPALATTATEAVDDLCTKLDYLESTSGSTFAACRYAINELKTTCQDLSTACYTSIPVCTICNDRSCGCNQEYLPNMAPWLQDWLLRHGHVRATQEQGLARSIFRFIPRATQEYLDMVVALFDRVTPGSAQPMDSPLQLSAEQRMAAEIFAHWLVFVQVLDMVWWVGDLGAEELRQLLGILGDYDEEMGLDSQWWPARMLRLSLELKDGRSGDIWG